MAPRRFLTANQVFGPAPAVDCWVDELRPGVSFAKHAHFPCLAIRFAKNLRPWLTICGDSQYIAPTDGSPGQQGPVCHCAATICGLGSPIPCYRGIPMLHRDRGTTPAASRRGRQPRRLTMHSRIVKEQAERPRASGSHPPGVVELSMFPGRPPVRASVRGSPPPGYWHNPRSQAQIPLPPLESGYRTIQYPRVMPKAKATRSWLFALEGHSPQRLVLSRLSRLLYTARRQRHRPSPSNALETPLWRPKSLCLSSADRFGLSGGWARHSGSECHGSAR